MSDNPIWPYIAIVSEGEKLAMGGIDNIWAHKWEPINGLRVTVTHPQYPDQSYDAQAYQIVLDNERAVFASIELSNMVYGFYAPDSPSDY